MKFASAVQDPVQHDWHWVVQSAWAGVSLHCELHSPEQVARQDASQSAWLADAEHWPAQLAEQSVRHAASHSKLPGSTLQSASQLA
jgi:hypothetical protein